MKTLSLSIVAAILLSGTQTFAGLPKRTLKPNNQETYNVKPVSVVSSNASSLLAMLGEGEFYGRLRLNTFSHDWGTQSASNQDNWATAIGVSLIYKTPYLNGFGATAGLYTSANPWHMDSADVKYLKAGKDLTSRYNVANGDGWSMATFAQAYLEYQSTGLSIKGGRQIVESFLTASNDTKMIPNTFEGISLETTRLPQTLFKAAYLTKEKLRDHETFHHLLAYGENTDTDPYGSWDENDDSAMHKGLTLSRLDANGIDDRLIVLEATNTSMENLTVLLNYTAVPELVSSATIDTAYAIPLSNGMTLTPGLRYLKQFDNGAGAIGGASLAAKITSNDARGYTDPTSVNGGLFGAKMELAKGPWQLGVGYTKIADEGDLIAPWRGFPTAGYTRMMGQTNWIANTKTTAIYGGYDFGKAGLIEGFAVKLGYAMQNFDDAKPDAQADSNAFTIDFMKSFKSMPDLYTKIRMGFINGDPYTAPANAYTKADPSYQDLRFEINYLF
jgi:hypothetical protein